jgi:hypothetical protein
MGTGDSRDQLIPTVPVLDDRTLQGAPVQLCYTEEKKGQTRRL